MIRENLEFVFFFFDIRNFSTRSFTTKSPLRLNSSLNIVHLEQKSLPHGSCIILTFTDNSVLNLAESKLTYVFCKIRRSFEVRKEIWKSIFFPSSFGVTFFWEKSNEQHSLKLFGNLNLLTYLLFLLKSLPYLVDNELLNHGKILRFYRRQNHSLKIFWI